MSELIRKSQPRPVSRKKAADDSSVRSERARHDLFWANRPLTNSSEPSEEFPEPSEESPTPALTLDSIDGARQAGPASGAQAAHSAQTSRPAKRALRAALQSPRSGGE